LSVLKAISLKYSFERGAWLDDGSVRTENAGANKVRKPALSACFASLSRQNYPLQYVQSLEKYLTLLS
jgi:hypothetical protein